MADKKLVSMVKKASERDHAAFVELCEMKAKYILYFCRQYMNNPLDAEDAAQEAFIRLQKEIVKLDAPEAFNTWLNKLLLYTCIDMRRKKMKDDGNISMEAGVMDFVSDTLDSLPEEYIEETSLRESVVEMVRGLPEKYKQCVLLHYYQNISYAQIAEMLNISPEMVGYNLTMARKHLKLELESKMDSWKQSGTPMMAISPALSAILSRSAEETVLPAAAAQCMEAAGVYAAFLSGGAAAAGAAGAAGTASITAFFSGPVLKGLLSAIAATTVAVTVLFSSASAPLPANVPVVSDPQRLPQAGGGYEDTASIVDAEIPDAPAPAQNISVPGAGVFAPGSGAAESPAGGAVVPGDTSQAKATSSPAATTPAVTPTPAAATGKEPLLTGSVVFKKADGTVIPGGGKYAKDFVVTLEDSSTVFAQTKVDKNGEYQFMDLHIQQAGQYSIVITPPSSRGAAFAAENPVGSLTVVLNPAEETQAVAVPTLYITDTEAPDVNILLLDSNKQPNPVNPAQAAITIEDETGTTCRWQVVTMDGSQVLYSGTGTNIISPFAAMASAGQTGRFILKVTATDAAGNVTEAQQVFYMV